MSTKITDLTALTSLASGDLFCVVDISDTSQDPAGTTKNITQANVAAILNLGALATVTPGSGVATALAINVGLSGAPLVFNGAGGTPSSITLSNGGGLPVSSGLTGAGTGVISALGVAVNTSGGFATSLAPVFSGQATLPGADIRSTSAMGALAIDTSKSMNTKSISVDSTFTFSGAPASGSMFAMRVTNSDTASHVLTIPSSFSVSQGLVITSIVIPASGKLLLLWQYDGSAYNLFGDPLIITGNSLSGTIAADNAIGGTLGQIASSLVASGSAVSLTTATAANVTSISLTAGDWDVEGNVNYIAATATVTTKQAAVNSTSATLPTDGSEVYSGVQMTLVSVTDGIGLPRKRINVNITTTVYLIAQATFSAGAVTAFGSITARRVR